MGRGYLFGHFFSPEQCTRVSEGNRYGFESLHFAVGFKNSHHVFNPIRNKIKKKSYIFPALNSSYIYYMQLTQSVVELDSSQSQRAQAIVYQSKLEINDLLRVLIGALLPVSSVIGWIDYSSFTSLD